MTKFSSTMALVALVTVGAGVSAQALTREELAKESEAYATETASVQPTEAMVMEKVNKGCELLAAEGSSALAKFQGKGSEYIFAGTYLWVQDMVPTMVMHPVKFALEGKDLTNFKDAKGKRFFVVMNEVVNAKGAGWVSYWWPKPGEKEASLKVSYVKKVHTKDGKDLIVGSGIYGKTEAEATALENGK